MTKICSKCKEKKELSEFYKDKYHKDGLHSNCKVCSEKMSKKWRENNPEKVKKCHDEWRKNNFEKVKKCHDEWRKNNPEKVKESKRRDYKKNLEYYKQCHKEYRQNNIEKIKENKKEYYQKNSEKIKERAKKWRKNNIERANETDRKKLLKRLHTDDRYRLKCNISALIRGRLKRKLLNKNGKFTFSFLPYTVDDLRRHLESLFEPWMNWQNYSNKVGCWVIDHKYPDSSFNYKSVEDEEFQKCWALENLQPMEFIENCKKGDKFL